MHPLVIYYSQTGTTEQVARTIESHVESPIVERIEPVTQRRYFNWLLRSCIPRSTVPIEQVETDLSQYDAVFLGTPKWTLSCPPVSEFIERADFTGTTVGLFMTYGGFDEERYLNELVSRLQAQGATVVATVRVQRDSLDTTRYSRRLSSFCDTVLDG